MYSDAEKAAVRDAVHQYAETHGFSCDEGYDWLGCNDRKKKTELISSVAGALPHRTRLSLSKYLSFHFTLGKKVVFLTSLHDAISCFDVFRYKLVSQLCAS